MQFPPAMNLGSTGLAPPPHQRVETEEQKMEVMQIAELYERYAPAIYARCRRLLGSGAAGRDALQESFVRVLQRHEALGPGEQALRYLYRTATNVCINQLRQRSVRERAVSQIAARAAANPSRQPVPGDREFVRLLLERCDETAVNVALMHFIDGMTQVEVAATLGITRRTVYNRIRQIHRFAEELLGASSPSPSSASASPALARVSRVAEPAAA
jgi:RNA polymerase sigma-70 factor (ECF subfamily)